MMTRKVLLGLLLFVMAIFTTVGVSAYFADCPPIGTPMVDNYYWNMARMPQAAKADNGTLYALVGSETGGGGSLLYESTDAYNWTYVHTFNGSIGETVMAINSTGILHIMSYESLNHMSYIAFNLTTRTNVTYWPDSIYPMVPVYPQMLINSTDGIRFISSNLTHMGIWFYNGSDFTYMDIPGSRIEGQSSMCLAENDSIYIGASTSSGNFDFWCWDEGNNTLVDLGSAVTGTGNTYICDIFVNNTTIAAYGCDTGGSYSMPLVYSNLPGISWIVEDRTTPYMYPACFFHMNGSRLEMTGPTDEWGHIWNTSYLDGDAWTELTSFRVDDPENIDWEMVYYPSIRRNRFHESDFWSDVLEMKVFCINEFTFLGGWDVWCRIYPNAAPSFLNLTVDTTYNETYLVNIDPRDLNPQDNVTSVLQDMNSEDDWLDYSGGMLSGTVGETDYGNTTVWVRISFDDGIANFTFNFTFNSERIQLLYTTSLPHGYLNIHYRGTIRVVNNTTWYAVTNAGWASIDNTTGEITGYPSSRGSFWFHIYLDDVNSNNTDDWNITIVIGIHPGDTPSKITELVTPIVIAVVGLVLVVTILYSIMGSLGSTFNRFGKS